MNLKLKLVIAIILCCGLMAACSSSNKQMRTEDIVPVPLEKTGGDSKSGILVESLDRTSSSKAVEPTVETKMVLSGSSVNYELKVAKVMAEPKYGATIFVPLFPSQLKDIRDKNKTEENWQVFASYAWLQGKVEYEGEELSPSVWVLEHGNYNIPTEKPIDGYIPTKFSPEQKKNETGWYHLRIWGQGQDSKEWLWINQSDPTCRNDQAGNPGYEIWVHFPSGEWKAVPTTAPTRK